MINIRIGNDGGIFKVDARGAPEVIAAQIAVGMSDVYAELSRSFPEAGKQFKEAVQRVTADTSDLWNTEKMMKRNRNSSVRSAGAGGSPERYGMINVQIGDGGEILKLHAEGDPEVVAAKFATAICVMYGNLSADSPELGARFKKTIQLVRVDTSPTWDIETHMKEHVGEGNVLVMRCDGKDGKSETE